MPGVELLRRDDWATMGWKKVSAVEPTTSAERTNPDEVKRCSGISLKRRNNLKVYHRTAYALA